MPEYLTRRLYLRLRAVLGFRRRMDQFNNQVFFVGESEDVMWDLEFKMQDVYDEYQDALISLFDDTISSEGSNPPSARAVNDCWKQVLEDEAQYYYDVCERAVIRLEEILRKPTHKSSALDSRLMGLKQDLASKEKADWRTISTMSESYFEIANSICNLRAEALGAHKEQTNKWILYVLFAVAGGVIGLFLAWIAGLLEGLIG